MTQFLKSKIRISKFETNSNDQNSNDKNGFEHLRIWISVLFRISPVRQAQGVLSESRRTDFPPTADPP